MTEENRKCSRCKCILCLSCFCNDKENIYYKTCNSCKVQKMHYRKGDNIPGKRHFNKKRKMEKLSNGNFKRCGKCRRVLNLKDFGINIALNIKINQNNII